MKQLILMDHMVDNQLVMVQDDVNNLILILMEYVWLHHILVAIVLIIVNIDKVSQIQLFYHRQIFKVIIIFSNIII
jgi:hypothetical protein